MRVLVTGSSGFIGSVLVDRLLTDGHEVRTLDVVDAQDAGGQHVVADVRDRQALTRAMADVEAVYHLAALVPLAARGRRGYDGVNIDGSRTVMQAALDAGVSQLVNFSSAAVYGNPACPVTARTPVRPVEPYGLSKALAEKAVHEARGDAKLPVVTVRPRAVLGPGRTGIFGLMFDWVRAGQAVPILGDGTNVYQLTHVDDVIGATLAGAQWSRDRGEDTVVNPGANDPGTLEDTLKALIAHAGTSARIRRVPALPAALLLGAIEPLGVSPVRPFHYRTFHTDYFVGADEMARHGYEHAHANSSILIDCYDQHGAGGQVVGHTVHQRPMQPGLLSRMHRLL